MTDQLERSCSRRSEKSDGLRILHARAGGRLAANRNCLPHITRTAESVSKQCGIVPNSAPCEIPADHMKICSEMEGGKCAFWKAGVCHNTRCAVGAELPASLENG